MKKLYSFSFLLATCAVFAQATDPFLSAPGTSLNTAGWSTHSGTAGQTVVIPGSLAYSALPTNGNKTQIVNGNSEDLNLASETPLTGTAYYSAVINVLNSEGIALNTDQVGNYFMSMGSTAGASVTGLPGRIYVRTGTTGNTFNLGILNNSGGTVTPSWDATNFPVGTPVFVVVKYDLASSTASLFINPSVGGTEGTATVTNATGTTAAPSQIASVAIRQATGTVPAGTGNIEIDTVRIGATWDYVVSGTLGVNQNSISGLKVYPNPVTGGTLYVDTDSNGLKSVVIYDVLGKVVVKTSTANAINVSNLKSGVYIVKITEEGKTATRKLVVR